MEQTETCGYCKYWMSMWEVKGVKEPRAADSNSERRSKRGQCRRYAPRASALTLHWPWMKAHETCGEFTVRTNERRSHPEEADAPALQSADQGM